MPHLHAAFRPLAGNSWRRWRVLVLAVVVVLVAAAAYLHWDSPLDRAWMENALAQRYHASVTMGTFHSSLFPRAHISGAHLTLRRDGDPQPLATIRHFTANAQWWRILFGTRRLGQVYLRGMVVNLARHPPLAASGSQPAAEPPPHKAAGAVKAALVLDEITIDQLKVHVFAGAARKPSTFAVPHLHLKAIAGGSGTHYDINVTLDRLSAQARAAGQFGPWNHNHPEATPLSGRYQLTGLNLAAFGRLHGILAARGQLTGTVGDLAIGGEAETAHIGIGKSGGALPLHLHFRAQMLHLGSEVKLNDVSALLGQSPLHLTGDVQSGHHGRTTRLAIAIGGTQRPARVQDIARLLSHALPPAASGWLTAHAQLGVAPGPQPVKQRLRLTGQFRIWHARFQRSKTEQKIAQLSRRGEGKHGAPPPSDPAPDFTTQGQFRLNSGVLRLTRLQFAVPGAAAHLHGIYQLTPDQIHLQGTLALAANPAQLTTGVKSLLLRLIGPFLSDGKKGTTLPITVSGSRHHPKFSLNTGKIFS